MAWGAIAGAVANAGLDLFKGHQATSHADFWNGMNVALQKEFAQNSIKWRVEDAKRAGVHPMAALGISPASFSPVSTSIPSISDSSYLSDMGQNIDRAIMAGKDQAARNEAEHNNRQFNNLALEKAGLENDLLRAQIDSMRAVRSTALTPPAPSVEPRRMQNVGQPNTPAIVGGYSGAIPLFTLARHGRTLLDVLNPDIGDSISESVIDNARAKIAGEFQAQKGYVKAPIEYLSPDEQKALKRGEIEVVRVPLGWEIRDTLKKRVRDLADRYDGPDWSNPTKWKWLNDFGNRIKGWF